MEFAENLYGNYPKGYIRTMQILFGENITSSGKDNIERFRKTSRMFSPDDFHEAYQEISGWTIPDINTIRPTLITPKIIDSMIARINSKALDGTLGDMSVAHRAFIARIRDTEASATVSLDQVLVTYMEQSFSYYRNVDDLTRRIMDTGGLSYSDPAVIANAKLHAQAVDRLRRERLARG